MHAYINIHTYTHGHLQMTLSLTQIHLIRRCELIELIRSDQSIQVSFPTSTNNGQNNKQTKTQT